MAGLRKGSILDRLCEEDSDKTLESLLKLAIQKEVKNGESSQREREEVNWVRDGANSGNRGRTVTEEDLLLARAERWACPKARAASSKMEAAMATREETTTKGPSRWEIHQSAECVAGTTQEAAVMQAIDAEDAA